MLRFIKFKELFILVFFLFTHVNATYSYYVGQEYKEYIPDNCTVNKPVYIYYISDWTFYTVLYPNCEFQPGGCPKFIEYACGAKLEYKFEDQGNGNFVVLYKANHYGHTCEYIKKDITKDCGGDSLVDWSKWDDATCSGFSCKMLNSSNLGEPDNCH